MMKVLSSAFVVCSLLLTALLHAQQPTSTVAGPAQVPPPRPPSASATQSPDSLYLQDETFGQGAVLLPSEGVTAPVPIRRLHPTYTPQALRQRIAGAVELRLRIGVDGRVEDVRVLRSLDAVHGLDLEAARVARFWTFRPAMIDQTAVMSLVDLTMAFRLN